MFRSINQLLHSNNSIKVGKHSLELLLDGRSWLAFVQPQSEEPQGFSSEVWVSRLAPVFKLALGELRLVGVPPDLLEITMDLESNLIRDGVEVEPSSEGLATRIRIERVLVGLHLQPFVGEVGNVSYVVPTDESSPIQLGEGSP